MDALNNDLQPAGRSTSQPLLPAQVLPGPVTGYTPFPFHAMGKGKIYNGYEALAQWMASQPLVLLDGYAGIYWPRIQQALHTIFEKNGLRVNWQTTEQALLPEQTILQRTTPFTGNRGDVWGSRCHLSLADFYDTTALQQLAALPDQADLTIVIGTGAALAQHHAPVVYFDLPKNELQYRMRAGTITNLGLTETDDAAEMYKRFYFVDWVVLNRHKKQLCNRIEIFADTQWADRVHWSFAADVWLLLESLAHTHFRVRPWFEAGAWGGQWIKQHLPQIAQHEVNYAWSFELIVPENGLVMESSGLLLELPFEWLMYTQQQAVLGKHAAIFGEAFPIRFDFLDTVKGGNLSIQCHPSLSYIREQFGETFTQDETYYILDCTPGASVYLGFTEDIDPAAFRRLLEHSQEQNEPLTITDYVQQHTASRHDLFLIPNGTVHSAGEGNLVLEISATPYIFTFKMYDWLRLGLDGKPRPINIAHAFANLNFNRKGNEVTKELLSKPVLQQEGSDWQLLQLPTHAEHFYAVQRLEFDSVFHAFTNDACLVLMLVEGTAVEVQAGNSDPAVYQFAETFVIPAAAGNYTVRNKGTARAKLVLAFVKDEHPSFHSIQTSTHEQAAIG